MFIDERPLFIKVSVESFIETETIFSLLFRNGKGKLRNGGRKIMLVDHFIKIPETVEKGFDDVVKSSIV